MLSWPRTDRPGRTRVLAALAYLAVGVFAAAWVFRIGDGGIDQAMGGSGRYDEAQRAGRQFLSDYVDGDGKVVRRDEGQDVVSEGQSYGMLIAVALGDEELFRKIWGWSRTHLQNADGLLSWRWMDGRVVDQNSAADADVDAARALLIAGARFGAADLTSQGGDLAAAVFANETVAVGRDDIGAGSPSVAAMRGSGRVVVAGPWAAALPAQVNPSYFSPRAEVLFAAHDPRWRDVTETHRVVLTRLLDDAPLPPDWAEVGRGAVRPVPHEGNPVRSGFDAMRIAVRYAESCDRADRDVAVRMRRGLGVAPAVAIRDLDGRPMVAWQHPIAVIADAAADHAAGDEDSARSKLAAAAELQRRNPTYYGAAWVALGYLMLQTDAYSRC